MFLGQISIFAGSPPPGFVPCDSRMLPFAGNEALAAVIGTTFGGDGLTSFRLPDLRSRTFVHGASGILQVGVMDGVEAVALNLSQIGSHSHAAGAHASAASTNPAGAVVAGGGSAFATDPSGNASFDASAVAETGGGDVHSNIQPYLALNICICIGGGTVPTP